MRKSLLIIVCLLGLAWLASVTVILFYVASLATVPALLGAITTQIAVFLIATAILLVSNTRRPAGRNPDAPDAPAERPRVMLSDGKPYGGRFSDDRSVVNRLSDILEDEAARRPPPPRTPDWAIGVMDGHTEIGSEELPDDKP